ncbi:MAG: hypothetical protein JOZ57_13540, partial [Abitibacteriaceae bacterium]|nr:hypothetical protein [Abditibacteriaceae bacterium]
MYHKSPKMSLLLTATTLALATAPGYSQPDIVPPLKEPGGDDLRLMILDKLKAAVGNWAYPGARLEGGGGAGARMELSCHALLTTKDPIAQVWAYYVNKTPPIKNMEIAPTAAAD